MDQIKISVRNLVEFILRSGDIDNRHGRTAQKEAMREGSRIHRKIQKKMGAGYQSEVFLNVELEREKYMLVIEGRADGIMAQNGQTLIDEIKGVYQDVNLLQEPIPLHLAQAKCYAYMYALQQGLTEISVQMTYCNLDTEEIKRFQESYSFDALSAWFQSLVCAYDQWAEFQYKAKQERDSSIDALVFPFPYRKGQKELAVDVYRTINRGKTLFIQAPTGTGKTITTVFPAVKAVGKGLAEKIFYLTARTITRTVAKEAFGILRAQGYQGRVLIITAKEKLCLCEEMDCNPVHCPYAKGHYDRVNDAVFDLIGREREIDRKELLDQAERFAVCPFEMCLDASLWVDNIICDYNYVFDPNVSLKRFFAENIKGEYLFLVDEAHNLVDRGRGMYSAALYKEDFLKCRKIIRGHMKSMKSASCAAALDRCNKHLLSMKRACEKYRVIEGIEDLIFALLQLASCMEEFFLEDPDFSRKKEISDFYLNLRHFLNMYDLVDENYVIYTEHEADGRFKLKLFCVNPAGNLQSCLDKGKAAVLFSATLLPIQYYKKLLSTCPDNYAVYAQTAFDKKQRLVVVAKDVSSKYIRRTQQEFERIASYIYETVKGRTGNYMVFFPSYKMMEQVWERFAQREGALEEMDCVCQESGMSERQREEFLDNFTIRRTKTLLGFCVMGGIFAEGIDLKREALIGVIIVGTGLPQISNEREILRDYYERQEKAGFAYAFLYPGMNKVLQAAGRVIRTSEDQGVILLLDERFLQQEYQALFPREWEEFQTVLLPKVRRTVEEFWQQR